MGKSLMHNYRICPCCKGIRYDTGNKDGLCLNCFKYNRHLKHQLSSQKEKILEIINSFNFYNFIDISDVDVRGMREALKTKIEGDDGK